MYTVAQLARAAGSTPDAVRHYTEIGLLHPQRDRRNNYRRYPDGDRQRLTFIRTSRELGFALDDIRRILAEADRGDSPCPQVRELYAQRLAAVEAEIGRLSAQREHMQKLLRRWKKLPDSAPNGASLCRLIDESEPGHCC